MLCVIICYNYISISSHRPRPGPGMVGSQRGQSPEISVTPRHSRYELTHQHVNQVLTSIYNIIAYGTIEPSILPWSLSPSVLMSIFLSPLFCPSTVYDDIYHTICHHICMYTCALTSLHLSLPATQNLTPTTPI